jgi:predicted GNAT superfamily acetyltransferase
MLAVVEQFRDSDTGYRLKMEQYRIAQEKGYDFLEWTYDPLESRNAHFNVNKLGCTVSEYEINIYGYTSSPLHAGMPTDRFVPHWAIPPLKKQLPDWKTLPDADLQVTSTHTEGAFRIVDSIDLKKEADFLFVEIPVNMQQLKVQLPKEGLEWRLKTRDVFLSYFQRNYIVYSFQHWKQEGRSFYVLKRA